MIEEIIWSDNGVIVNYSGEFNRQDSIEAESLVYSHSQFPTINYVILNYEKVESFQIDTTTVAELGKKDTELYDLNPSLKLAFVSRSDVIKGLVNVYLAHMTLKGNDGYWEMEVFNNNTDAYNWIGRN